MQFSSQDGHCMTLPKYMVYLNHPHTAKKCIWKKLIFTNMSSRENLISLKNNGEKNKVLYFKLIFLQHDILSPIFEILKHGRRNWKLLSPFSGVVNQARVEVKVKISRHNCQELLFHFCTGDKKTFQLQYQFPTPLAESTATEL